FISSQALILLGALSLGLSQLPCEARGPNKCTDTCANNIKSCYVKCENYPTETCETDCWDTFKKCMNNC
ncbi:MAG TPA: hypothetical protein DER04_01105, partial [Holosporales bacterium]|nr:hypothetical protein [Holosporales bacterium]HBW24085.1 hypothetical protein [Holosporales bacterium]HCE95355.1 hypothetical protein [Holosporales bacterium]